MTDNKKRWLVLIGSLLINLCIGCGYAWSVFSGPLREHFGWDASQAALVFTIANGVSPIVMITGGKIQDKFGPRWVVLVGGILLGGGLFLSGFVTSLTGIILSYGLGLGLGMGLVYTCTVSNTVKFFPNQRGLVGGLSTGFYGLASVVAAPIANALIGYKDVFFAFKVFGLVYLAIIVICSFFQFKAPVAAAPKAGSAAAKAPVDKSWKQMLCDPMFYVLILALTLGATAGLMLISQGSAMAQEMIKVDGTTAALGVSLIAIANTAGRIIWGLISDKLGRYNTMPAIFILLCAGLFLITLAGEGSWVLFIVMAMLVGFCFGGLMGIFPAVTADNYGLKNNGVNYGIMFIGFALGGLIGPQIAASIRTASGTYVTAFVVAGVMAVVGVALSILTRQVCKKRGIAGR